VLRTGFPAPPVSADTSVDQPEAGNAESRIALGVSDRRALGLFTWLLRAIAPERASHLPSDHSSGRDSPRLALASHPGYNR